jgi:ABC-type phosphate/phosphonate transport system substrate-binding protein
MMPGHFPAHDVLAVCGRSGLAKTERYSFMKKVLGVILLLLLYVQVANAALVFSAPPRESEAAGKKLYGPLANYLTKILGQKVVYKHPGNWVQYAKDMREGHYDIVFDGPHFSAWRLQKIGHVPVVRLSGSLEFVVIAFKDNHDVTSIDNLIGRRICGIASPNLGTVAVFSLFSNPVNQPMMVNIKGGPKQVLAAFLSKKEKCVAAVIRDNLYNAMPPEKKQLVKVVARSKPMPNQTITIRAEVLESNKDKVYSTLLSGEGSKAADNIFSRFSKKKKFFVPAELKEYDELEGLLEGVVFGW